jgi:hypothetical protein
LAVLNIINGVADFEEVEERPEKFKWDYLKE